MQISATDGKAITTINEWLISYRSENTRNTYHREFKRLSTWLLAVKMSFTEIDSDHLSRYLNDFALGKLDLDLNKQQQKKRSNCHSGKRCITPSL